MLVVLAQSRAAAQTAVLWADSAQRAIAAATAAGDLDALIAARALTERALTRFPDDGWLLHYRGFALYREGTLRQGRNGEKAVAAYLEQAEETLKKSAARLKLPETHALLSSVIGMQIGSNPLKGMTLGPRSDQAMDDATQLGPNNPRVWLVNGIGTMFKPKMFGGGADRAEEHFRKAIKLFDADQPTAPAPSWGRDEAWLWLGQVLEAGKRYDEAKQAYQKALEFEPRNDWVRQQLLPNLEKRMIKE